MALPAAASAAMDEATSFEAMNKEMREVISELKSKGELLAGFRREYEKLYRALEKVRGCSSASGAGVCASG